MTEIPPLYGVHVFQENVWDQNMMELHLDVGRLLICSMAPGDYLDTGHFIVIRGHFNGKFHANDPFSCAVSSQGRDYGTISGRCRHIWSFEQICE